jgi:hypothetical protein
MCPIEDGERESVCVCKHVIKSTVQSHIDSLKRKFSSEIRDRHRSLFREK